MMTPRRSHASCQRGAYTRLDQGRFVRRDFGSASVLATRNGTTSTRESLSLFDDESGNVIRPLSSELSPSDALLHWDDMHNPYAPPATTPKAGEIGPFSWVAIAGLVFLLSTAAAVVFGRWSVAGFASGAICGAAGIVRSGRRAYPLMIAVPIRDGAGALFGALLANLAMTTIGISATLGWLMAP